MERFALKRGGVARCMPLRRDACRKAAPRAPRAPRVHCQTCSAGAPTAPRSVVTDLHGRPTPALVFDGYCRTVTMETIRVKPTVQPRSPRREPWHSPVPNRFQPAFSLNHPVNKYIEPGPDLWHSLTIYQLGALLHDLIARTPLFQAEYEQSRSNRYRFAWVVATQTPRLQASDVADDLLFIAHRALDKDWTRRSALRIDDFLHDPKSRQRHAFQMLGMLRDFVVPAHPDLQNHRMRVDRVSLVSHIFRTTPATIGSQRGPVATAS